MLELYTNVDTAGTIVHCALEFAGAPHRLIVVDNGSPPGYTSLNPNGTVPTLVEGDLVLYETVAVLEHLVDTLPGLGPRAGDPHRPQLHFWLAWLTNNPMAAFYRWFKAGEMIDPGGIDALQAGAVANLTRQGQWLEDQIRHREWLLGETPTVADIYQAVLLSWADEIDGLSFGGDAVAAHAARTRAIPGVAAALEQEAAGL